MVWYGKAYLYHVAVALEWPFITVPLRILGQQPIQNAAPTPTMFIIVALAPLNERCSQHYGVISVHKRENWQTCAQFVAELHQNAPNCVLNFKKFPWWYRWTPYPIWALPPDPGRGKGGKAEGGRREREEERGRDNSFVAAPSIHSCRRLYSAVVFCTAQCN